MNNTLFMNFTVDRQNKSILVNREFAAELPLVWDAFTKSELLDQWWAPRPWKARTKTMDFTQGGYWLYAMVSPAGEEHWAKVNFRTIQPQTSFTALDEFTDAAGNSQAGMPQSIWKTTFNGQGGATRVTCHLTFEKLDDLETLVQMNFKEGLSMAMDNLDELLAKQNL